MISIIMPAFNVEKTIQEAIDSILNQTYKDFELIVIDDGSTDKTPEICKAYGDKIRYIRIQHSGNPSIARNYGIVMANGDIIAYQDADDISLPTRLETEHKTMIETNADMVYAASYIKEN